MTETLAGSKSPFLQHGAHQPVKRMPWGRNAFERALREDKPILLDIGAVWCHWCHVMDRESYEDASTAALTRCPGLPRRSTLASGGLFRSSAR